MNDDAPSTTLTTRVVPSPENRSTLTTPHLSPRLAPLAIIKRRGRPPLPPDQKRSKRRRPCNINPLTGKRMYTRRKTLAMDDDEETNEIQPFVERKCHSKESFTFTLNGKRKQPKFETRHAFFVALRWRIHIARFCSNALVERLADSPFITKPCETLDKFISLMRDYDEDEESELPLALLQECIQPRVCLQPGDWDTLDVCLRHAAQFHTTMQIPRMQQVHLFQQFDMLRLQRAIQRYQKQTQQWRLKLECHGWCNAMIQSLFQQGYSHWQSIANENVLMRVAHHLGLLNQSDSFYLKQFKKAWTCIKEGTHDDDWEEDEETVYCSSEVDDAMSESAIESILKQRSPLVSLSESE